ncbi:MAG: DUF2177 family protein [Atopostipes suicloacalis]|nr:DUF2177 family protein [Atopostipes suicloacalis]
MTYLKTYLVTFVVFFIIDLLWLGLLAKDLYRRELGEFMAPKTNWPAAIIFYAIFIAGLIYYAINPALASGSWFEALKLGAIFGFITYLTYDMTNLATLENWPLKITVIDILWGTSLNSLTSLISFFVIRFIR